MLYSKNKDIKNRNFFQKKEKVKLIYKFIFINLMNKLKLKKQSFKLNKILFIWQKFYLKKMSKVVSKVKLIRRCTISNRNRGNLRILGGLSRITLKNFINFGIFPGYRKAVW